MNHSQATKLMATERYLLNELAPDAREAFEEHAFDCPDCALDLRAGAAFVEEAKAQLPFLVALPSGSRAPKAVEKRTFWPSLWRPAFAAPAFAALLILVGYQNLVTFPALRESATQPRLIPVAPLHPATRGAAPPAFAVDRAHGVSLPIDLSSELGTAPAASYAFELRGPRGQLVWTGTLPASTLSTAQATGNDQPISLLIPGGMLRNGSYSLTISSVDAHGSRSLVDHYNFDIVVTG